jgi:hypothetical protein
LAALLSILKLFSCLQNELKDFYFGVSQGLKVKVLNIEKRDYGILLGVPSFKQYGTGTSFRTAKYFLSY